MTAPFMPSDVLMSRDEFRAISDKLRHQFPHLAGAPNGSRHKAYVASLLRENDRLRERHRAEVARRFEVECELNDVRRRLKVADSELRRIRVDHTAALQLAARSRPREPAV